MTPEEHFRLIADSLPMLLSYVDSEERFRFVNKRFEETFRRPIEEILGCEVRDILGETAYEKIRPGIGLARAGQNVTQEMVVDLPGAGPRNLNATVVPHKTAENEVAGFVVCVRDVTELRQAEEDREKYHSRLRAVVENATDAIFMKDREGRYLFVNSFCARIIGHSLEDTIGKTDSELFPPEVAARFEARDREVMAAGVGSTSEEAIEVDGSPRTFLTTKNLIRDKAGNVVGLVGIARDITERKELRKLQLENLYLQEERRSEFGFEEIVGRSQAIQHVLDDVRQVAATDSTVLLTGETGTGKELIARAIHKLSDRKGKMLVKVNCAALPSGVIESELFGHEKGSFTGALSRKIGRFELADEGTIFLDEIGDLPQELQAKLLRVLQEGELERVGGEKTIHVNVRVIAATNRDLEEEVQQKRFRADLFYRLNVFPIRIPPLRERRDDIPPLVRHFVLVHGSRLGKKITTTGQNIMELLVQYDWPGNVRELQNVIERGVILSSGPVLDLTRFHPASPAEHSSDEVRTLEQVERKHILSVLEGTGWRVSGDKGAAELLGMKRTTLEARMKKLGIRRS